MKFKISLLFILAALCLSCEEEQRQEDLTIDETASFTAEVNGKTFAMIVSDDLMDEETQYFCSSDRIKSHYPNKDSTIERWTIYMGSIGNCLKPVRNSLLVTYINHFSDSLYQNSDIISKPLLEQVLTTGNRNYAINSISSGIYICWTDSSGNSWTTIGPSVTDHTGDYYTIDRSVFQYMLSTSTFFVQRLDVSFECKLYNRYGETIRLKNGKLKYNLELYKAQFPLHL